MSAALLGSSLGLGLGVTYMAAGLSRHAAEHAEAVRMAEAASDGYTGSYLETPGSGLHLALNRYSLQARVKTLIAQKRFAEAARARHRADLECLTDAVYYEARSESARGQAAVAQVVLNRVKHPAFPKTVCGVVFQGAGHAGCQFSFTCDGSMRRHRERAAWEEARQVAGRVLAGRVAAGIGAATHYHTTAVNPYWAPQMLRVTSLGVHVFYRFSPYRLRAPAGQAVVEQAVLVSRPAGAVQDLRVSPTLEKAIESTLQPITPETAKAAPAAKPAEAAMLTTSQPVVGGAS